MKLVEKQAREQEQQQQNKTIQVKPIIETISSKQNQKEPSLPGDSTVVKTNHDIEIDDLLR